MGFRWFDLLVMHHDEAARHVHECNDQRVRLLVHAQLAEVSVQRGLFRELRRIRRALEAQVKNQTAALNLSGAIVAKEGSRIMTIGPFTPNDSQDVAFTLSPVNAAGEPTSGPFEWNVNDPAAGTLQVSADTKACRFVTAAGSFAVVVSVKDPKTGVIDVANVSRTETPVDNNTVSLGLAGELVAKLTP